MRFGSIETQSRRPNVGIAELGKSIPQQSNETGRKDEPHKLAFFEVFSSAAAHEFHLEQDYTKRVFASLEGKHLASAIAPNRLFSRPERAARVGSIPIARSTFRCLPSPCVAPGRDLAYRPVPTASIWVQPFN